MPRKASRQLPAKTYKDLEAAYKHFNARLFGNELPACLITVQRQRKSLGYFSGARFTRTDQAGDITDEIALNPEHFSTQTPEDMLSTLVHEMVHLWQHHFGKPSRWVAHNREWAKKMRAVGLISSDTGKPAGKETGRYVSHYIEEGGPFAHACAAFLSRHTLTLYHDRAADDEGRKAARRIKNASKTKFSCKRCGANAWGKPDLRLICGACFVDMEARWQIAG